MFPRLVLIGATATLTAAASGPLIDYVTYLGGSYADTAAGIAVNSAGSAYVAGTTQSPDFPLTSTALGVPQAGRDCAFITKLNPTGTAIDFSICLAGSRAVAFTLDPSGNLYLAVQQVQEWWFTGFSVVKLDPTGTNTLYTTDIGGYPESMAVDSAGNVYVAGSSGPGLTTTPGAFQSQYPGGQCPSIPPATSPCTNAFVLKLAPSGSVTWSTYLGGSGQDDAHAVAVDSSGNVWVAGETVSPDFPTTPGALSRTFHGEVDLGPLRFGDGFVAKLDPTGGHLLYSTYLGGSAADGALSVAVDPAGAAYVVGGTQSADFPITRGSLQPVYSGSPNQPPSLIGNGFVTKFDASGHLVYSTFIGSSQAKPVIPDAAGQAYLGMIQTAEPGVTLPGCSSPASISVLNAAGSAVVASSPIPGQYLALDGKGDLYSSGLAYALVFFSTPRAFQTEYGGGDSDAFVAKVDFTKPAGPSLASVLNAASFSPGYASPFPTGAVAPGEIVTVLGTGFGDKATVSFDQFQAPILYASNCQINAVVPFEVTPGLNTFASVQSGGQTIGPVKLPVVPAAPGLFTMTQNGSGQAAVLNQDGTVNSVSNPAARVSTVAVFLTGSGVLNPQIADGSLGPLAPPFPEPIAGISVSIAGVVAPVVFAGQAPGLIAGATQVNVRVPQSSPIGVVPITVFAANYASQLADAVTIAVK
jgi:uncharacterized protein (TIGR03437 family)